MYENFWDVLDLDNCVVTQLIALAKIHRFMHLGKYTLHISEI